MGPGTHLQVHLQERVLSKEPPVRVDFSVADALSHSVRVHCQAKGPEHQGCSPDPT